MIVMYSGAWFHGKPLIFAIASEIPNALVISFGEFVPKAGLGLDACTNSLCSCK